MVKRLQLALREAGHRCLNEWQVLAVLVDIEMLQHRNSAPIESLERLHTHIRTTAAIHNLLDWHLPLPESSERVSVKELLDGLLNLLQVTYAAYDLDFELEEALISRSSCCSLALICSELVCNAVKHGTLKTQVRFYVQEQEGCLQVRDDGAGFPDGFDPRASSRMGLEIVESLCHHDLRGQVGYANYGGGGQVTVTFPVWSYGSSEHLSVSSPNCEREFCLS